MGGVSCWAMPLTCPVRSAGKGSTLRSWTRLISPGNSPSSCAARRSHRCSTATRSSAGLADHHALEVSDEVHQLCDGPCRDVRRRSARRSCRRRIRQRTWRSVRRRSMLDVSYAGSALVGQAGAVVEGPSPGVRFPACHRLSGTGHHLIVFGEAPRLDSSPRALGQTRLDCRCCKRAFRCDRGRRAQRRRHPRSAGRLHWVPRRPRRRDDDGRP